MAAATFEPKGIRFYDQASGREMLLVADEQPYAGWLCYRHPDGQWVTLRKATEDDRRRVADAPRLITGPTFPGECADCGMTVLSDAEAFLHATMHSEQQQPIEPYRPGSLASLPYILYPAVVKLLEEYKRSV